LSPDEQSAIYHRHAAQIADVREALWDRHHASLPEAERAMLDDDTHPSYSWGFAERAMPYRAALEEQLAGVDFVGSVSLDGYHGDTLVLTVRLTRSVPWQEYRRVVPELFRGFQVLVAPP
jgi:hypothetical protein